MSILTQKQQIFGNIAAARALTEGLPNLTTNSSFPSINNNGDTVTFLCDLIRALIGADILQQTITDALVYNLSDIEKEIKNALKINLKSIVSCGVDPSLPAFMLPTGSGIQYTVNKVDFTDLMRVNPTSDAGKLLYNDLQPNLINSSDFNTFLYQTIQNDGIVEAWPQSGKSILTFQFNSVDVTRVNPNNTITVKAHQNYVNKSLTDLNNNFIDSISLFNTQNLVTNIIDMVFGTLSSFLNKGLSQLETQAQVNTVIGKISNSASNDIISDKYFNFSSVENIANQANAQNRKLGQRPITTSGTLSTSIPFSSLQDLNTSVGSATSQGDKRIALSNSLNSIGNQLSSVSNNNADNQTIQTNFIQDLIDNLIKAVVNSILSPKVVTIFMVNFKIIYGPTATFTDPIDFLKKNKNLVQNLTKEIGGIILKILLSVALKEIKRLMGDTILKQELDKNEANLSQLLSLIGIPQDTLRQINGLL